MTRSISGRSIAYRVAARLDRGLFPFMGPAQLGAGHEETRPADASAAPCPLCGASMTEHRVDRSADPSTPTYLRCPARA